MLHILKMLWRDQRGIAGPIVALAFTAIISSVGASIDYARAQMAQAKLSDTLDASALAAGSIVNAQPTQTVAVAQNYFNVNFPQGYMDATLAPLQFTNNVAGQPPIITASATIPTMFMGVVGINTMTVAAHTEIATSSSGLELALVMDNTGSMAGQKLTELKSSATELVNILFGNANAVKDDLWIGLVPFSQAVNIGKTHTTWLNTNAFNWGPSSWGGCVDAQASGFDQDDVPPTTAGHKLDAYFWPSDTYNRWITSTKPLKYASMTLTRGPNAYCPQVVTPMTNQKTDILAGINSMIAAGNTHVNLGLDWGWRMLSPKWRGLWGGTMNANNLPLDYGTANMQKVVIMLTDGQNTMSNGDRTAYWYLSDKKLGTTSASGAVAELDKRTLAVCNAMKAKGIVIYTILYDLIDKNIENLYTQCASKPEYFFSSPDYATLHKAFQAIGDSLSNLRISR
ncbi:MAG: pilus assembly protein [Alphaproteobacteria bacterium]|nr:pilus assembly protein [Alphaproteobacteria bacterium]